MWHALVWIPTTLLLAVWSLLCWGAQALLTGPDWSAGQPAAWLTWLEQWQIPLWLAAWLPLDAITELKAWLTTLGPWIESALAQLPSLVGWLVPLLWLVWALGGLAVLLLGVAGSVLVAVVRRSTAQTRTTMPNSA